MVNPVGLGGNNSCWQRVLPAVGFLPEVHRTISLLLCINKVVYPHNIFDAMISKKKKEGDCLVGLTHPSEMIRDSAIRSSPDPLTKSYS